jgi:CSLREA domain-containing protein
MIGFVLLSAAPVAAAAPRLPSGTVASVPPANVTTTTGTPGAGGGAGRLGGSLDAGNAHTCTIGADGQARCWGNDTFGQSTVPPATGTVTRVTAGGSHSCAIKTDGNPACWGFTSSYSPMPPGTVIDLSAGSTFTCAIRSDSTPECWGAATHGETTLPPSIGTVRTITAGSTHVCAIKTDGTPICWGDNTAGATTIPAGLGTVTAISAGTSFSCAIKTNGFLACWGANGSGQSTVPPGLVAATAIDAGAYHACVIRNTGVPLCWGSNGNQQTTIPGALGTSTVTMISAGAQHSCAVKADGNPICWGNNTSGRATPTPGIGLLHRPTIVTVPSNYYDGRACGIRADGILACWTIPSSGYSYGQPTATVTAVSVAASHGCGVHTSGIPACWGNPSVAVIPGDVGTVQAISTTAAGSYGADTCAIRIDSTLTCWGDNSAGQTSIPAGLGTVTSVATSNFETCAVKTDSTLACWGSNSVTYPVPAGLGPVRRVQLNTNGACAIKVDGTVACWGLAGWAPFQVPAGLGTVTDLTMASNQTCVLKTDGTPACFGYGSAVPSGALASVSTQGSFWCGVTAGWVPTCAGDNTNGQLDLAISLKSPLNLSNNVPTTISFRLNSMAESFALTGEVPPGLTFTDGILSGTPIDNGSYTFTVTATRFGVLLQTRTFTATVTFGVNQTSDEVDTATGDGRCVTASGTCSLRAAIQEANADPGPDTIGFLLSDTYTLTRAGMFENAAATGDLDISDDLTIVGAVYVNGGGIDRVFHLVGTPTVSIVGLNVYGGKLADGYGDGAGILVSGGSLTITGGYVYGNDGKGWGGGVHVAAGASLTTASSPSISGNSAGIGGGVSGAAGSTINLKGAYLNANSAAFGGAVSSAGNLTMIGNIITGNTALASGGGVWATGSLTMKAGSVNGNTAADYGGGIGAQGPTTITSVRVTNNTAKYGGGVAVGAGTTVTRSLLDANHPAAGGYGTEVFNLGALTINISQIDASASSIASAIYNGGSTWNRTATLTITDTTIASIGRGATIRNDTGAGALTLTNTIVQAAVDPAHPSFPHVACGGTVASGGYNLASDSSCAIAQTGDAQGIDPQLGPLTYTGYLMGRFPGPAAVGTGKPGCSGYDYRQALRPQSGSCDKGSIDV